VITSGAETELLDEVVRRFRRRLRPLRTVPVAAWPKYTKYIIPLIRDEYRREVQLRKKVNDL